MDPYLQQQLLDQQQQQQLHHTPRYRHVSAPVNQSQNLSSFQESMRQDSVVVTASPSSTTVDMTGSLSHGHNHSVELREDPHLHDGYDYNAGHTQDKGNRHNLGAFDQEGQLHYTNMNYSVHSSGDNHQSHQGTSSDKDREMSTGHVGIMIDHQHGHEPHHQELDLGQQQQQPLSHQIQGHGQYIQGHSFAPGHTLEHGHHSPVSSSQHQQRQQQQQQQQASPAADPVSPPTKSTSHSNRTGRYSGMFQQGYSQQHQSHFPGATLSRHLSIQLAPNQTLLPPLLPPPPPAVHTGASHGMHSTVSIDGNLVDSPVGTPRDYAVSPSMPITPCSLQQNQNQPFESQPQSYQALQQQQLQQTQQQVQQQGNSQASVALPPPTAKYIRSPIRSPKMPQLSSQAMAHAQAQSQSQFRRHHASSQLGPPPVQNNQYHLPPRTHRRSIQPLTLEQQQPKGGSFRYVRNQADLWPQQGSQKYRSIDAYGHSVSPLRALTLQLTKTYSHCNRDFKYEPSYNPRRVLTKPSKPMHNEGYDNEDYDYILYVSDILGSEERQRYVILDVLGQGTFGQVVKCQNLKTNAIVAVKVIKNKPAYFNQSMMEVTVLELLNERYDMEDRHHILRLQDTFIHRRHLCLVFELLSVNLYELIKQNQFRGLRMSLVRVFTAQLLDALCVLNEARIIHCDLKPENILLKNLETPTIKVIDFGSACHEQQTVYTYIQSRFYRSPEVLVGLPYSSSIDIWSVGCIAAELFLGLPLFPGSSEYNQLSRIVEMLGILPTYMLEIGKTAHEFFEQVRPEHSKHSYNVAAGKKYRLKSMEAYSREHNVIEQPSKRYFQATTLPDIINSYPMMKKGMTQSEIEKEMTNRASFINFLQGLLNLNPIERWSPQQAKLHPFITGEPFTGNFIPPTIPKKPATAESSVRLEPTLPGRTTKNRSGSLSIPSSTSTLSSSLLSGDYSPAAPRPGDASSASKSKVVSGSSQTTATAADKESSNVHASASTAVASGSMATSSASSPGSSLTDVSSLNASPALLSAPLADGETTQPSTDSSTSSRGTLTFALDTQSNEQTNRQISATLSSSSHHHQRPRATTMGTMEVPKNMAQLAAAITPQQGQSPAGSSNISHRIGPNDASHSSMMASSSPYSSTGGSGRISGLRQIPERSEQNSPTFDGTTNPGDSLGKPLQQHTQQRQQQQHQNQQLQPHRYLLRSGSYSTGKGTTRSLQDTSNGSAMGYQADEDQLSHHPQSTTLQGFGSSSRPDHSSDISELTPLQRMQQQLLVGQSQYQQQQQRHRFHFGYPQSSPSLNGETFSSNGVESNSSSRHDGMNDLDFDTEGGHSLRQLSLGSHQGSSSESIESSKGMDEMEELEANEYPHSDVESTGFSETQSSSRGGKSSGSPYNLNQRGDSGLHHSFSDGAESPGTDSAEFFEKRSEGACMSPTEPCFVTLDDQGSVLSNVEEEEEGEGDVEEEQYGDDE
ncbi:dual specificity protein kinase yak1 [Linnemannia zychae]|nr:dual specificity protein kinase yak1 [Linnemannia zychae]